MSEYRVYWIHRGHHIDISSEGYVGITRESVERRIKRHLSNAKRGSTLNPRFYSALLKYTDLKVSTLCICDKDYALLLENKLRPVKNVGWNVAVGGRTNPYFSAPKKVVPKKGKPDISGDKHPNWQGGISNWRKFYCLLSESPVAMAEKKRKAEEKALAAANAKPMCEKLKKKLSDAKKRFFKERGPWANSQADKYTWKRADCIYEIWKDSPCGNRALCRKIGMVRNSTIKNMIKMFRDGWIPLEDDRFLEFKNET